LLWALARSNIFAHLQLQNNTGDLFTCCTFPLNFRSWKKSFHSISLINFVGCLKRFNVLVLFEKARVWSKVLRSASEIKFIKLRLNETLLEYILAKKQKEKKREKKREREKKTRQKKTKLSYTLHLTRCKIENLKVFCNIILSKTSFAYRKKIESDTVNCEVNYKMGHLYRPNLKIHRNFFARSSSWGKSGCIILVTF
jgi:hypothetical protein